MNLNLMVNRENLMLKADIKTSYSLISMDSGGTIWID